MNIKKPLSVILTMVLTVELVACGGGGGDSAPANDPSQFSFISPENQQPAALQNTLNSSINVGNNINLLAESQPQGLGFNVNNIASHAASLGIDHINAYAITYNTPGVNPQTNSADINREVSGLILVPMQANGSIINNIKGMVVFYHPTELAKNSVPSCLTSALVRNTPSYCNNPQAGEGGDAYFQQLSAVYAAAGYIVIAPDYIGEGIDNNILHPYVLYPKANADSGLYMIGPARALLAQKNLLAASVPLDLFITGFSEGGAYALNASKEAQTALNSYLSGQNVNLKITAPAEGAYDVPEQMEFSLADLMDGVTYCGLSDTTPITPISCNDLSDPLALNSWNIGYSAAATGAKPTLVALALTTLGYYGLGNNNAAYESIMSPGFFNIPLNPSQSSPTVTLVQLLTSPSYTSSQIANLISNNAFLQINSENQLPYGGQNFSNSPQEQNNSISVFLNPNALNDPSVSNILKAASTYNWTTNSPINFIHLQYDSVVAMKNYDVAYPYMSQVAAPNLVTQTIIQNASIADADQCQKSDSQIFCQPSSLFPGVNIPIDHSANTLVYIGALCAFEHSQGFNNICS